MTRGFTLVEMLVAMVLLAMFAAILGNGQTMLVRSTDRTIIGIANVEERILAVDALRRLLDRAVIISIGETGRTSTAFVGTGDRLWFVVSRGKYEPGPALSAIELVIENNSQSSSLQMRIAPFSSGETEVPSFRQSQPRTLIIADQPLTWNYLADEEGRTQWIGQWHERQLLPLAVRLASPHGATFGLFPVRVSLPPFCAGARPSDMLECSKWR